MQQKNTLDILNELIASFYSSRLIIVDKTISKFLKTLVENKELFSILTECVSAYNYETEYQNALTTTDSKTSFLLPRSRRKTIALVSGLLYEFDNKSKNIIDFVTTFFPAETTHESYINFLDGIITPFSDSLAMLLTTNYDLPDIAPEKTNEIFPDAAKEQCTYWLTQLSDSIIASNKIDEQTRSDAMELIKGMFHTLELQNPIFIKYVWIGLKNTLKLDKSCTREIQEINNVLYNYAVLDQL